MAGLSAYLLDRERRHWTRLYELRLEGLGFETPPSSMSQVVFTAALTGAAAHSDGTALLGGLGLERPGRLLTDHTTCYPPEEPGAVLEPLYPDRLAEDFLALSLPGHQVTGHPTAPWAADVVGALVARAPDGSPPAHLARALTFLASAAAPHRWPHAVRHLETLLHADPALAVDAGGAALTALAALDLAPAVLEAVDAHLPRQGQPDLDAGIAAFTRRLTDHRLAATDDPAEHARLYQDLGFRMLRAGHRDDAMAVTEQAVAILLRLAAADGGAYEPALATALAELSERAFAADRAEASRRAVEEAVGIFRRLTAVDAAYEGGLAVSLSYLGQGMTEAREPEEGLAATERAMGIFQRLAATDPATYEPGLAMTLSNAAIYSWRLRRWSDALTAAERALAVVRRLVAAGPAAHASDLTRAVAVDESDLATALSNLGFYLWGARRRDEAVIALREAVGINRRLAEANPTAHEAELARVLSSPRHLPLAQRAGEGGPGRQRGGHGPLSAARGGTPRRVREAAAQGVRGPRGGGEPAERRGEQDLDAGGALRDPPQPGRGLAGRAGPPPPARRHGPRLLRERAALPAPAGRRRLRDAGRRARRLRRVARPVGRRGRRGVARPAAARGRAAPPLGGQARPAGVLPLRIRDPARLES
ncbi:tetratricopeptide repeat protein [Streptomyces sp. NPDC001410]|uniref:tetratricopeptide repeat protein n=1 Tax=Streptomyces sp. NPDC001410 TaxID=3364574 RepID=UPI0036B5F39C